MSSGRKKGARGSNISPSSSPPLPPPPTQDQSNRGPATPHHFETVRANPDSPGARLPKAARSKKRSSPTPSSTPGSIPSGHATRNNNASSPQPSVVFRKRGMLRRWIARILLIYLSYTFVFICPSLPNQKSNKVCDTFVHLQDWLRPYTEPVAVKIDETYRTYGEPLVDQYGRPLYQQSQQYYSDYMEPALKTASVKAKENYHQYAHPHVVKVYDTIYTDDVKARVHKAQNHLHEQLEFVKHKSKAANDHVWHLHAAHVHPVVEKVSPHAKLAWEKASLGANRLYDGATVLYLTHVNPYAQESWIYIQEAADHASDVITKKADEIWGTSLHKAHQAKKKARGKKAQAHAAEESLKEKVLRKASEAQKAAGEYSETIKAAVMGDKGKAQAKGHNTKDAATEKGHGAQKIAHDFAETVSETFAKKAHEAQKVVSDEAEYIKKMADDKVHEAGKVSDKIKKTVHEAQEAVARQAEHIKHSVVDAVHGVEDAAEHELEHLREAAAAKKKLFEKKEKGAEKAFKSASDQAAKDARQHVKDAQHVVEQQIKHAQDIVHEDAEWIQKKAGQAAKDASEAVAGAKHAVEETIKHAQDTAQEDAEWIKKKVDQAAEDTTKAAEGAKHAVEDAIKHAQEIIHEDAEWIKDSAQHAFQSASKGVKDAQHAAEHQSKVAQKAAQDAIPIRKHAQDAKHDVRDKIHQGQEVMYESMDMAGQIVMSSKEKADEQIKGASVKVDKAKDVPMHKAHDAHTASKVALAAMLAGIEKTFSQFYRYEETETENLWNKLQSAIDEHIAGAKKSAQELEKANKETYEVFEGYVKDWASEAGDLEERLVKLGRQQVDSIKKIGQRTETDQGSGKSKAQILTNNVEVYITGLRDFLSERLAASRETVASELGVFKDTSSEDDEHQAREKLAALEKAAREKLKSAGMDARDKAHELLKQIDDIWAQSEARSKEYVRRTRDLAAKAGEEAKLAQTKAPKAQRKVKGVVDETEPDVQVAPEEPGSGHRHHRHHHQ